MTAVLIDDDYLNNELLDTFLRKYCPTVSVVGRAESVEEALEVIASTKPDILFLDIELHNLTAKDVMNSINLENLQIILISAFEKYALEMHKYPVTDYLLKPLKITDLIAAVNKAEKYLERLKMQQSNRVESKMEKYIALPEKDHLNIANTDEILHLEANGNYTRIVLRNQKSILSARTLKDYEEVLPKNDFLRVHKSHIVNLHCVSKYLKTKNGSLVLTNGTEIPISANRKREVTERIVF